MSVGVTMFRVFFSRCDPFLEDFKKGLRKKDGGNVG